MSASHARASRSAPSSTRRTQRAVVRVVLQRYGRTYAREAGIRVERNTPAPLFQLLVLSLLLSARIAAAQAVRAARALWDAKLTTPRAMSEATWQQRVDVLTHHGYTRYDESTSTRLGETADLLLERYDGDLRLLRDDCNQVVAEEHRRLQAFKGIGRVGADIFLREAQGVWREAYPYADPAVTGTAERLGLPSEPEALGALVSRREFPRLAAGLIRVRLDTAYDEVRAAAG